MADSKLEKIANSLMKAQTRIAKLLGTPRMKVMHTDKMMEKALPDYAKLCEKMYKLAYASKQIQDAAKEGGFTNIERKARKCKIKIKSEYEQFVKAMGKTKNQLITKDRHVQSCEIAVKELLDELEKPLTHMLQIYNTAVGTYNDFAEQNRGRFITPSAPEQPTL